MNCHNCGSPVEAGEKFCANCGSPVQIQKYCEKCGKPIPFGQTECPNCTDSVGQVFCPVCGYKWPTGTTFCGKCGNQIYRNNGYVNSNINQPIQKKNKNSNNSVLYILIIAILVVAIGAAGFVGYMLLFKNNNKTASNDVEKKEETNTQTSISQPTQAPAPVFNQVVASSTRGTDTEGGQYSEWAVLSEDPMTKWVPSKNVLNGIDEWIQIEANTPQHVTGLRILNGYHKSPETWSKNNRVRNCTVSFSNGVSRQFTLDDTMQMINLPLSEP